MWMICGVFLTLLSSASIFLSSVDLFLCLAKFLNVSSRMLAACGRGGGLKEGGGGGGGGEGGGGGGGGGEGGGGGGGRSKKGQGRRSREERKSDEERDEKGEGGGEEGGKWRREEEGKSDGRGKGKRLMMSFWCLTTVCVTVQLQTLVSSAVSRTIFCCSSVSAC